MPGRLTPGVLFLTAALGLGAVETGCSKPENPAVHGQVRTADSASTLPLSTAQIDLEDAGAAPRVGIATPDRTGDTQQLEMTVHSDTTQQVDSAPPHHVVTPDISVALTAKAQPRQIALILGACMSPDPVLAGKLAPLTGTHAVLSTQQDGAITALHLVTPSSVNPKARTALESSLLLAMSQTVAFPKTAVGPGAVWTIRRQFSERAPVEQTMRIRLLSVHGTRLQLEVDITQGLRKAARGGADNVPVHGHGILTVDRGLPLPVSGTVTMDGVQLYHDTGNSMQLRQSSQLRVTWGG